MATRREFLAASVANIAVAAPSFIVGCSPTGAPFSFIDIKTDQISGVMVDIVQAISQDAGFKIDLRPVGFPALFPSLVARKIDIIASAVLKTPARTKVATFSSPLFRYGAGIVIRASDSRHYRTVSDFKKVVVGAQTGTRFLEQVQASPALEVKTYDSLSSALRDLTNSRIDIAYGDAPILQFHIARGRFPSLKYVQPFTPPALEDVCMVMRKQETELARQVNMSISRLQSTALQQTLNRWQLAHG